MIHWADNVIPFGRDPRDAPRASLSLVSDNGGADPPSRPEPSSIMEIADEIVARMDWLLSEMERLPG